MTTSETVRLIEWLIKKGYTLEEILNLLQYIAQSKKTNSD